MHLNMCKGTGIETSEIAHEAAAIAGLPQGSAYQVHVRGTRAGSAFHAKGVSVIRHTAARGARSGELPAWERPDKLLGKEDTKRLEVTCTPDGGMPRKLERSCLPRKQSGTLSSLSALGTKPASSATITMAKKATEKFGADYRKAAWLLKHQVYVDDTTAGAISKTEATSLDQPKSRVAQT
jgi:hypothetical protein